MSSPTLLLVNYTLRIPVGAFLSRATETAGEIAKVPGLTWKIWGLDENTGDGTSFYLFENRASAEAFERGPIVQSLRAGAADRVTTRLAPVHAKLSAATRASAALAHTLP